MVWWGPSGQGVSSFQLSRAFGAVGVFGMRVRRVVVMVVIMPVGVVVSVVMMMVVIILRHEAAHAGAEQIAVGAIGHV